MLPAKSSLTGANAVGFSLSEGKRGKLVTRMLLSHQLLQTNVHVKDSTHQYYRPYQRITFNRLIIFTSKTSIIYIKYYS